MYSYIASLMCLKRNCCIIPECDSAMMILLVYNIIFIHCKYTFYFKQSISMKAEIQISNYIFIYYFILTREHIFHCILERDEEREGRREGEMGVGRERERERERDRETERQRDWLPSCMCLDRG